MKFFRICLFTLTFWMPFCSLANSLPADHTWVSVAAEGQVVWVGSDAGRVAHSVDSGETFELSELPNSAQVRQLTVLDDLHGYALTSGVGRDSALFITRNGGFSWRPLYRGEGGERLRCMGMNPNRESWILGDTQNNSWHVVSSNNGRHWRSSRSGFTKRPLPDEQASNTSDSCMRFVNDTWLMGTQNAETARIMHKKASDLRFTVEDTPLAGVSAVWPLDSKLFLVAGGSQAKGELYLYREGVFTQLATPEFKRAIEVLYQAGETVFMGNGGGFYQAFLEDVLANKASWQPVLEGVGARGFTCTTEQCWLLGSDNQLHTVPR
ncbi:hypothetical protein CWE15_11515 [Aliidiomarina taiwanensis]|uniref:Photosynthesis system II assembly factor Ycf48/Hcf136-like domain-containing protein n=1 Tax=Aliidiomarina taiwanensis TaxID=946228 RepID=A0A432WTM3_9GAMM|nr:hypothetical protein [Aliidiomarina taiwanensis]RUO37131.1 hypothetical protein CWE15_11515 [Aliidiomarina taiwanensis]